MGSRIPWHMATIDERPEDIYTQVKKTPHHLHRAHRSKLQQHFTGKHRSKSLSNLEAWENALAQQRKANTVDNLASLSSLDLSCPDLNQDAAAIEVEEAYRAQMERMYAEVALAYMRANVY